MRAPTAAVLALLTLVAVPEVRAQESLAAARDLYASADYNGALAMLDGLLSLGSSAEEQRSIELYRVLCLVATRREDDAKGAMETFVRHYPLYHPTDDLPPRVRASFDELRGRLLPSAVQAKYLDAKAAFDAKDYTTAQRGFTEVLEILSDPDVSALATQSPLSDLRVLASGFRELSAKAPEAPEPAAAAAPPALIPAVPPAAVPQEPKIYDASDTDVVPPIAIEQRIPSFPGPVRTPRTGLLEVVIDEMGEVESASIREPLDPQFDRQTLAATRKWRYQPARVNGAPVKFLKRIQLSVVPDR